MGLLVYLLQLNLVLMAAWILYQLAFKKLTFFRWNRFYFLGSILLSFWWPLIKLPKQSVLMTASDVSGINWEPLELLVQTPATSYTGTSGISLPALVLLIYLLVVAGLASAQLLNFHRLRTQMRRALQVRGGRYPVYLLDSDRGSFTYLRRIYLDRDALEDGFSQVYRHERVHASQLHSLDLMVMAFLCVVFWFNPFAFLLLRSVRENHEFLADAPARSGPDVLVEYLACLREQTMRRHLPTAVNPFKSPSIKKRIIMLTNDASTKVKKTRYLLVIPILSLLLLAYQVPEEVQVHAPVKLLLQEEGEGPSIFPLPAAYKERMTQSYGKAMHPFSKKEHFHRGVDLAAPTGTDVMAPASGKVQETGMHEAWGTYLILAHGDNYSTRYTHLSELKVEEGELVNMAQVIATVGNTGLSTGPHLHYEVWKDGEHVNPADYY